MGYKKEVHPSLKELCGVIDNEDNVVSKVLTGRLMAAQSTTMDLEREHRAMMLPDEHRKEILDRKMPPGSLGAFVDDMLAAEAVEQERGITIVGGDHRGIGFSGMPVGRQCFGLIQAAHKATMQIESGAVGSGAVVLPRHHGKPNLLKDMLDNQNTPSVEKFAIDSLGEIGAYTGNGDEFGSTVNCGFKPAYVLRKNKTSGSSSRSIVDPAHPGYNPDSLMGLGTPDSIRRIQARARTKPTYTHTEGGQKDKVKRRKANKAASKQRKKNRK